MGIEGDNRAYEATHTFIAADTIGVGKATSIQEQIPNPLVESVELLAKTLGLASDSRTAFVEAAKTAATSIFEADDGQLTGFIAAVVANLQSRSPDTAMLELAAGVTLSEANEALSADNSKAKKPSNIPNIRNYIPVSDLEPLFLATADVRQARLADLSPIASKRIENVASTIFSDAELLAELSVHEKAQALQFCFSLYGAISRNKRYTAFARAQISHAEGYLGLYDPVPRNATSIAKSFGILPPRLYTDLAIVKLAVKELVGDRLPDIVAILRSRSLDEQRETPDTRTVEANNQLVEDYKKRMALLSFLGNLTTDTTFEPDAPIETLVEAGRFYLGVYERVPKFHNDRTVAPLYLGRLIRLLGIDVPVLNPSELANEDNVPLKSVKHSIQVVQDTINFGIRLGLDASGQIRRSPITDKRRAELKAIVQEKLILSCDWISLHIARTYAGKKVDKDDLEQVARLGIVEAARRYDPERNPDFVAYAYKTALGVVKKHFRDNEWGLKVSRTTKEAMPKVGDAYEALTKGSIRPTVEEIAEYTKLDRPVVEDVLAVLYMSAYAPSSLEDTIKTTSQQVSAHRRYETRAIQDSRTAEAYNNAELKEDLRQVLSKLPERLRAVIYKRYIENKTQEETAQELGVSQVTVSRLESHGLGLLRSMI